MNKEFERLEHVATEYFGGFSALAKKIGKNRQAFYFYKDKNRFGRKFLEDLEKAGINPTYIKEGLKPMFLNLSSLENKYKEKYLDYQGTMKVEEAGSEYSNAKELSDNETKELLKYLTSMPLYKEVAYANTGTVLPDLNQFKIGEVIEKTTIAIGDPNSLGAVEVSGNSMKDFNIVEGGRVIFNKSLEPKSGNIVVVIINGHLMVKQLIIKNGEYEFHSGDGGETEPIVGCPDDICEIIGVVTDSTYKFI